MYIIAATHNKNKLREFEQVFGCNVYSASELGAVTDPEETGATFQENADIKAEAIYQELMRHEDILPKGDFWITADDSGLCVEALNGAPGVYSARYASTDGHNASDSENVEKLLRDMEQIPEGKRQAAFACALSAVNRMGEKRQAEGHMQGVITREPRGSNGFGYDPILYIGELGKTVAEMTPEEKNARSHRGQALRKLMELIG